MKLLLSCIFAGLFLGFSFGQTPVNIDSRKVSPNGELSNAQRYGYDYELIDYDFSSGDSTILDVLDLPSMEYLRHDTMDQAYRDTYNGVVVLIYSRKRVHRGTGAGNDPKRSSHQ